MEKILITGRNGQLGSAFFDLLGERAVFLTRNELDLSKPDTVFDILDQYSSAAIINCAAYTAVDNAEDEEDIATVINAQSVGEMARFCADKDIPLIHYSTDYVFEGSGVAPWEPSDKTCPINAYGRSKLAGEKLIKESGCDYLIFRISWVYDAFNKNFFNSMLKLGTDRDELSIVDDQVGAPSYAPDIAHCTLHALDTISSMDSFPTGIYHLCGRGEISWYEFAKEIFDQARNHHLDLKINKLQPIASAAFPTKAKRPLNSRMNCILTKSVLKTNMPDWHESLEKCFTKKLTSDCTEQKKTDKRLRA